MKCTGDCRKSLGFLSGRSILGKTMKHRALRVRKKWMWKSSVRLWKSQLRDADGLDSHRVAERKAEAWGHLGMGWNTHVQTTCASYLLESLLGIIPRTAGLATSCTLPSCSSVPIPSLSQPPWSSLSLKYRSCALGSSFPWSELTPARILNTFRILPFNSLTFCLYVSVTKVFQESCFLHNPESPFYLCVLSKYHQLIWPISFHCWILNTRMDKHTNFSVWEKVNT